MALSPCCPTKMGIILRMTSKNHTLPCKFFFFFKFFLFLKTFVHVLKLFTFVKLKGYSLWYHIFVKVFFESPFLKMWKFSLTKGRDGQHSLSYRYMRIGILYALIPHIYPSVGYCVVYFQSGPSTTFIRINGISSTLSFF